MESITFAQCVEGAWRDGWRYLCHRPAFAVLLLPYAWLSSFAVNALRPDRTPPFRLLTYVPLGVFTLLENSLFSLLIIHAIRFVLLDNDSANAQPISGPSYWRYLGCTWGLAMLAPVLACLVLALVCLALALYVGVIIALDPTGKAAIVQHPVEVRLLIMIVGGGLVLFAGGISCFVLTRLSLLHTHVAIGGTVRIREVWTDTRGHCWSIWLIQLCVGLPTLAASVLVAASGLGTRHPGLASLNIPNLLGTALATFGALYLGAPCSAWLYRRYGNSLRASPAP
ncbi:hypothetical protein M3I53_09505 [Paraburkholderia sp. CNPSo 3272]|uniref:hypothetical protein n=1 Tax=Paraburkholderia sp. CNPSo 3272 TaxID=2940931 RepID=UPI0020B63A38|nr:hypothetical protein [Paraburkholderia sp. CNPSo 3272]MCP3723368.1 hypothetical protein [Paraburkholderia sp. CNPSo 3272]